VFVRNWGNEGFCSQRLWTADFTTYTFRIPWRTGMTSVSVSLGVNETEFEGTAGTSGPEVVFKPDEGIDVTFTLPPPSERPLIDGELHLQWHGGVVILAKPREAAVQRRRVEDHEEESLPQAIKRLPPAKWKQFDQSARSGPTETRQLHRLSLTAARQGTALATPPQAARVGTAGAVASLKSARDAARLRALCAAWDGAPPGIPPGTCGQEIR